MVQAERQIGADELTRKAADARALPDG